MGLFGLSKKERDLKTLSEKEIQLRLYGHLRAPHAASHDKAAVASNKPIRPVILGPQVRSFDDRKQTQTQNLTTETLSTVRPSQPKSPKTGESDDLFSTTPAEVSRPKAYPTETPAVSQKPSYASSSQVKKAPAKPGVFAVTGNFIVSNLLPLLLTVVKTVFGFLFQLIAALIGFVSSSLLKIDFKNPKVRRIFSWTLGLGLLAFLLIGIHVLNLKREVAMKHPKKVSVSRVVKHKKNPIPQQVATQTLTAESSAETTQIQETASINPSSVSPATATSPSPLETISQKGQVIQIATFAVLSDAEKLVAKLKQNGWPCFAKPLVRPGGKTYFCVFLGAFKTYQEAETKLVEFKKKEISKSFQDAFIRSL